jgi:glycosyltransferase involved in cell wall biosynthesis
MVSTEYPPMVGGVGRYAANLSRALRESGIKVDVVCNDAGKGDFYGISPSNQYNSEVLLDIVKEAKPDLVHVQYEHGLYGLSLDPINPKKTNTNIDNFYDKCDVPIVTTFHSGYTYKQWMSLVAPLNMTCRDSKFQIYTRMLRQYCKHLSIKLLVISFT